MPSIKKILRPGYYRRKEAHAEAQRIMQHEAEQKQREAEQKQHEAEQKQHEAEQKQHEAEQKQHEAEQKQHEAEQKQHEAEQKQHEAEQKQHEAEQKQHEAEQKQHEVQAQQLRDIAQTAIDTLKSQERWAIAVLQNQEHHLIAFKNRIAERSDGLLLENAEDWLKHKLQLSQTLPVAVLNEKKTQNPKQKIDSILLELPEPWVKDEFSQPNRPTTDYFVNISLILSKMNLEIKQVPKFGFSDTAPCLPADNQICISFHSHGSEERVWRVKESYIPPYFSFDRMGYSGFSELAQHPETFAESIARFPLERAAKIVSDCKETLINDNISKYGQPDISNTQLPKDYIFYPLQQAIDTVTLFARVHQSDAIWHLAEQSAEQGVDLVLKRHPHCTDTKTQETVAEVVQKYPNTHLINASVNELIPNARAIVGANSGVLFEALIHGKPVYSFASSDFQLATIALQDKDDFVKVFTPPPDQTDDVVRFLGWYLIEYCFRADDLEQLEKKVKTCLKTASLSTPPNMATRRYIQNIFGTLELARRQVITDSDTHLKT